MWLLKFYLRQVTDRYSTYYLTLNKGRLPSYFWIVIITWVTHRSLLTNRYFYVSVGEIDSRIMTSWLSTRVHLIKLKHFLWRFKHKLWHLKCQNMGILNASFLAFLTPCFLAFKMPILVITMLLDGILKAKSTLRNWNFEIGI